MGMNCVEYIGYDDGSDKRRRRVAPKLQGHVQRRPQHDLRSLGVAGRRVQRDADEGRSSMTHHQQGSKVAGETSRKIIAALQVSLDGLIEGPNGELDWIGSWEDSFDLLPDIDTCILGGAMYPGYEQYWLSVLADPDGVLPFTGKPPSKGEIEYARFADKTPHVVLSQTLESVAWRTAQIARDVADIRGLKQAPGKKIHAVGGASLVSTLMNERLVDELRLTVHPLVLGKGKPLFKDVDGRHRLELLETRPLAGGRVRLTYDVA